MLSIGTVHADERAEALSLLLESDPAGPRMDVVDDMLAAHNRGEFSLEGLLAARDGSQIAGAILYVAQGDGTAFIWPAGARDRPNRADIVDLLYREIVRRVDAGEIGTAQAILETGAAAERQALTRNGFRHLADLFYLQRPLDTLLPPSSGIPFDVTVFCEERNAERFARTIEETYVDTLDCPDFHENRGGREALASHRCSGEFDAARWKLFSFAGHDVGVLLLNDHPAQEAWEVVYMGVTPSARGRGYGRAMLIDGLHAARLAGRKSMLLAVDARNTYANRLYEELGFIEVASRAVHVYTR